MSKLPSKKKHKGLFVIALFLFGVILWMIWGNTTIEVSHFNISNNKIPEAFNGYKIAQVSDLHNKKWGEALVRPIREEEPDMIVITGDLIDALRLDLNTALEFIDQIKDIAPIYFILGNHETWSNEYDALEEHLTNQDVIILDSKNILLTKDDEQILLLGVHDPSIYIDIEHELGHLELLELEIQELTADFEGYKILLSHRAEYFDMYTRNDVDLVFAGHAHGGQFRLPFIGGLYAPNQGYFPKYTSGVYEENGVSMVVSRGLGNSVIPVRFNNRSELVFVELISEE